MDAPPAESETKFYVQLCNKKRNAWDMFEGFVKDGTRHGPSRCSWSDGDVLLCRWILGNCEKYQDHCDNKKKELGRTRSSTTKPSSIQATIPKKIAKTAFADVKGICLDCKEMCTDEAYMCLNCKAEFCVKCNKQWKTKGFGKQRPPCLCIIDSDGMATKTCETDFRKWIPKEITGHIFKRKAASTLATTTLIVIFQHVNNRKTKATALCNLGQLSEQDVAYLLDQEIVRQYVMTADPKPAIFLQLEKRWTQASLATYPLVMDSQFIEGPWSPQLVRKIRPDVDSLTIKNFKLTNDSIENRLVQMVGRPQLEIGCTYTKVRPAKGYHIICGPRPVVMVYCDAKNANAIKWKLAETLGKVTNSSYTAADSGFNVFKSAPASADARTLFKAWLEVANNYITTEDEKEDNQKMFFIDIVFHGWKSSPGEIHDPFADETMYSDCKSDSSHFEVKYDIAQKYEAVSKRGLGFEQAEGIKMVNVPVFGMTNNLAGFKTSTWSMFGPICGEHPIMGSLKLDRNGDVETCLPANVTRVKIYSSLVNLIKSKMSLSGVSFKSMTHKKLRYHGDKVQKFLDEVAKDWKHHAPMLRSFRIECTMELTDTHCTLQDLRDQEKTFEINLMETLRGSTKIGMIAVSDVLKFAQWSLKRYRKKSRGANKTVYYDKKEAKDMLLSLWHSMGYRYFPLTKEKHARFLVDMSDEGDASSEPTITLKKVLHVQNFDWSDANCIRMMLQILEYMNVTKFTFKKGHKAGSEVFRYMWKKTCPIPENGAPCPWCYSSRKLLKKIENEPGQESKKKTTLKQKVSKQATDSPKAKEQQINEVISKLKAGRKKAKTAKAVQRRGDSFVNNIACKSNDFSEPIDLAIDVQARLAHHLEARPPTPQRWTAEELQKVIASIFFPAKGNGNHSQAVISAVNARVNPLQNGIHATYYAAAPRDSPQNDVHATASAAAHRSSPDKEPTADQQVLDIDDCSVIEIDDSEVTEELDDEGQPKSRATRTLECWLQELCRESGVGFESLPITWKHVIKEGQEYIRIKDYVYDKDVFAKGNAPCHIAWCPKTRTQYCMKKMLKGQKSERESELLARLMKLTAGKPQTRNLITYHGCDLEGDNCFLKFELVHPSNNFRSDLASIRLSQVKGYMRALLQALVYLHQDCKIVHRDIKPANFVHRFDDDTFRLIDFGSAKDSDEKNKTKGGGTAGFKAPEILMGPAAPTPAIDVWSAGIILFSLLTGQKDVLKRHDQVKGTTCDEQHLHEIGTIVGQKEMRKLNTDRAGQYGDGLQHQGKTGWIAKALQSQLSSRSWSPDNDALDLMSKMLEVAPYKRITSSTALEHQFLSKNDPVGEANQKKCPDPGYGSECGDYHHDDDDGDSVSHRDGKSGGNEEGHGGNAAGDGDGDGYDKGNDDDEDGTGHRDGKSGGNNDDAGGNAVIDADNDADGDGDGDSHDDEHNEKKGLQKTDEDHSIVPIGHNVLAHQHGLWFEAIVVGHQPSGYEVLDCDTNEMLKVSSSNIKRLNWDYWKRKMSTWNYDTFRNGLVTWGTQIGPQDYDGMGRGAETLEDFQIGTVVAEYSGCIAYKEGGGLFMGGLYPEMDLCSATHQSVRSMQNADWKQRKNHAVTIGRHRGSQFCIDGYATTSPALDNLHNHGGIGWGPLLNTDAYDNCNCELIWVANPNLDQTVVPYEELPKESRLAGFLVTKKSVSRNQQLTWYYRLQPAPKA